MSMKILSITVLLVLMSCWFSAGSKNFRGPSKRHPPPPCCTSVSRVNVSADVIGDTYQEQAAHGPCVRALIFNTSYGQVCIGPFVDWARKLAATMKKQ